jgi:pyruvate/2-oxoglutarate dehydrogenase complex dihydrolipoamide acyltransferase (E2) component
MQIRILETAPYGRLNAVEIKAGVEMDAREFGDLDYIQDCVNSGHIEIVDEGSEDEQPEQLTKQVSAAVLNSMGEIVAEKGIDATDAAVTLADNAGVKLSEITGSGKEGRILVSDVEAAITANSEA